MHIQFFQYYLLKRLSFPPLNGRGTLIVYEWTIYIRVYLWDLYSVSLAYLTVPHCVITCGFVVSFEIRKCDSNVVALLQHCFGYLRSFGLHMNFRMDFHISGKKSSVLIGIPLNLWITLGGIDTLAILGFPVNKHRMSCHYLCVL